MELRVALALLLLCSGCPAGQEPPKDVETTAPDRSRLPDGSVAEARMKADLGGDRSVDSDWLPHRDVPPDLGGKPDLSGKPDLGGKPDQGPMPDTRPPPSASVVVSKGASAQGLTGCSSSYCRFIVATTANFTSQVTCSADSQQGSGGFSSWTQGANQTKQSPNYFGYPGQWVSVTCIDGQKHTATGKTTW